MFTAVLPREHPAAGYFALVELQELNSGYYHDVQHAIEVADLTKALALNLGHSSKRAEFLKQVALLHDADPRLCLETGHSKTGTPARVQVTLAWMESEREKLEKRFNWKAYQFEEACALIARTDYPFDENPRELGTRFDGKSPVEVYRECLWKLPRELRSLCLQDSLLLRFADQVAAYVGSYRRAHLSVCDLTDELRNAGLTTSFEEVLKRTPDFLAAIGSDLHHDQGLKKELNLSGVKLMSRQELRKALGWKRRLRLVRNQLRFHWAST